MTNHFEAKLYSFRRTKEGVVVSYVVHPDDVSAELATAQLGTRYMIGFAEIGDDDKPKTPAVAEQVDAPASAGDESRAGASPVRESKDRKLFVNLPLSQQAGMRATQSDFLRFLLEFPKGSMSITVEKDEDIAPEWIRKLCGVDSRSQIVAGTKAGDAWLSLENRYQSWLTDQRFAEARR